MPIDLAYQDLQSVCYSFSKVTGNIAVSVHYKHYKLCSQMEQQKAI